MTISDERFELNMQGLEADGLPGTAAELRARDTAQQEAIQKLTQDLSLLKNEDLKWRSLMEQEAEIKTQREALVRLEQALAAKPADDLANACIAQLIESGAENYLEHHFDFTVEGEEVERPVTVTVQFKDRPSPHQLRLQAEAERDTAIAQMQNIRKNRDRINKEQCDTEFKLCIAQQQLAEAVGLLSAAVDYCYSSEAYEKGRAFLARHVQAEQQEAKPQFPLRNPRSAKFQAALEETFQKFESMSHVELEAVVAAHMPKQEAQGAQAGDERAAFESWTRLHNESLKDDCPDQSEDIKLDTQGGVYCWSNTDCAWQAWKARAALATQPAERECNCPKIGERFSAEKHGGPCPVHDAVRGAEHE